MSSRSFNILGIGVLAIMVLSILGGIGSSIYNSMRVTTINQVKVEKLEQQQIIRGSGSDLRTEIRYLIITDKETFISESSLINGKFDNSNIFFNLKEGEVYDFKVAGYGKSLFFDYRNVLEYKKLN